MKNTVEFVHLNGNKIIIKDLPERNVEGEDWLTIQWKLGSFIDQINYTSDPEPVYSAKEFL